MFAAPVVNYAAAVLLDDCGPITASPAVLLPNVDEEVGAVRLTVLKPAPRQKADAKVPQDTVLVPEITRVTSRPVSPVVVPLVGQLLPPRLIPSSA